MESYDYIIVGAGSAGCVLANRLTQDGKTTVCLVEAGPIDKTPMIKIPGAFAYFMFSKKYNWGFNSTVHPDIRNGEPMFSPRGKTLGGSSAVNGMVYIRGQKEDYDNWASAGNSGWSYDDLLPYFIKSETNERGPSAYHGNTGPLHVSDGIGYYQQSHKFVEAVAETGYPLTDDFNGSQQEGAGLYQFTIKNGERCGVARGYLHPIMARNNLTVITNALTSRIILSDKTAQGIQYSVSGVQHTIYANKEVLISGGTFNSPQLLMLSGIGDPAHLKQHNIDVIHELPGVGKNLQDHVDACVLQESLRKDGFTSSLRGLLKLLPETVKYFTKKSGKLSASITESGAFLKTDKNLSTPDVQMHFLPLLFDDNGRDLALMAKDGMSLHVCVLRPKSRGSVSLSSSDPTADPVIDYNFFDHPEDAKTLIEGIKISRNIMAANALSPWSGQEIHPGKDVISDQDILDKCKERLGLVYHPVGTCKMGNDELAVVDDQLRVHGIENLRVVDASIMPTIISGNTNATTIVIAEKAADLLLAKANPVIEQQAEDIEERPLTESA